MSAPAPSPFCSAEQRNAYLTEVQQPASARALENVARANGYLDQLNALYAAQSAAGAAVPTLIAIHAAIEAYQPVAAAQQRESAEVNALYAAALAEPVGASCPSEVASGPPPEPPPSPSDGKVPCPDRKPITVGRNRQVGSGAQMRQKAMSTALGLVGGLIGGGGSPLGGGGGGSDGPQTVKCRIADREMTVFDDPESGISLKVGAKRTGDSVLVYAGLGKAPDAGTFQSAFLERGDGAVQGARDVGICDLWGEWKLTVSWTRTTYVNNQMVSRESGGWSKSGDFRIPGILSAGQAPDGLWKRLGFSNASHGARRIVLQYALPRGSAEPVDVVIHVTRPGGDPVITAPFVLRMREGPAGFVFERAPSDCPETATAG